jgi:tetratricopeptide (TPR) repeat protein
VPAPLEKEAAAVTAENWRAQGEVFSQQNNFAEAVRCFTEAIAKEPQNPLYYKLRGSAWHDLKEYAKAVADQGEAIRLDPNNGAYYNNRAIAYEGMNDNEKALADYNKALALGGTVSRYCNRALLFEKLNYRPKAIADYEKALEMDPGNQSVIKKLTDLKNAVFPDTTPSMTAEEWSGKGKAFSEQENYGEAVRCFTEAITLDPNRASYYEDRASAYEELNENEKAIADYTTAIRLDPESKDANYAYWNRALIFDKLKRYYEAIADYLAFFKFVPDDEDIKPTLMEKALERLNSGGSPQNPVAKEVSIAIDIYTSIIEQDESYPHIWTQRGLAKMLGVRYFDDEYLDDETFANYKVALPDLDRAIEEDEEDGDAYAYRAEIHWRCGKNDDALEDLQRAFDLSAHSWTATADEMYNDGVELPEEILDGLREEGYIESDDDEGDEEDE